MGPDRFQECCEMRRVRFSGWNFCALAQDGLCEILDALSEEYMGCGCDAKGVEKAISRGLQE